MDISFRTYKRNKISRSVIRFSYNFLISFIKGKNFLLNNNNNDFITRRNFINGCCFCMQIANEKISKKYRNQSSLSGNDKAIKETFRIVGLGRNAIVVVLGTLTAFIFEQYNMCPFTLTGK